MQYPIATSAAISTSSAAPVPVTFATTFPGPFSTLEVLNAGAGDGFISMDGGETWFYIPLVTVAPLIQRHFEITDLSQVILKRNTSTNLVTVYVSLY